MKVKSKIIRDKHLSIVGNWFNNINEGKTNDEILLLIGLNNDTEINIRADLTSISEKQYTDKFFTIEPLRNLIGLENIYRQNIILYSTNSLNFEILANTNRRIICIVLDTDINPYITIDWRFNELILNSYKYKVRQKLDVYHDYLFYIKKRNPIEVINQNTESIKNLLSFFLDKRHLSFKNSSRIFFRGYHFDINKDIDYFDEKAILTSRLAIIIYKLSTLSDISDRIIGDYYTTKFGMSSTKKTYKRFCINSKCYDLNKSPFFKSLVKEGKRNG